MHAGKVDNPNTVLGSLWRIMKKRPGYLWDAYYLAKSIYTTCLSTHIAALRQAVPDGWEVPPVVRKNGGHYYTIRRVKKQKRAR